MNATFFDILAWFGLAYSIFMLVAIMWQRHRLTTKIGELEQMIANMDGYEIKPKPAGPYLLILAVSVAWLVSQGY